MSGDDDDDDDLDAFFDEVDAEVEKVQEEVAVTTKEEEKEEEVKKDDEEQPAKKKAKTSKNKNTNGGVVVVSKSAVTNIDTTVSSQTLPSVGIVPNIHTTNMNIHSIPASLMDTTNVTTTNIAPPLPPGPPPSSTNLSTNPMTLPQTIDPNTNKKVIKRSAAGQTWEDPSLAQFPQNDFRLFVGNLAKDITDAKLAEAFQSKYPSFAMAKVIFSNQDGKSKGYGFVSLMDPKDCAKAIREMDQTWIGSRPIKVKRSDWKERSLSQVQKKKNRQRKKRNNWL